MTNLRSRIWPRSRVLCGLISAMVVGGFAIGTALPAMADVVASSSGPVAMTLSTPGAVLSGVDTTYTITVTNTTSAEAVYTQVTDWVPVGIKLNTLLNPDLCARSNKAILPNTAFACVFSNLAPGASASVSFTATASAPGTYSNQFQVQTNIANIGVSSSLFFGTLEVSPGPTDIQVTGSASTGSPTLGSTFQYVYQVKNNGPQGAYGVTFDDALPASVAVRSATTDTGTCSADPVGNSVHCDLGNFIVGGQAKIVISAVAPTTAGSISNTATIAMLGPDTHPANNAVTVVVQPK